MHYHIIVYDNAINQPVGNVAFENAPESITKYLALASEMYRGRIDSDFATTESSMYEMVDSPGDNIACGANMPLILAWVVCMGCKNPFMN